MNAIELVASRPQPFEAAAWVRWGLVLCAASVIIMAHGCHGPDEDHELFAGRISGTRLLINNRAPDVTPGTI